MARSSVEQPAEQASFNTKSVICEGSLCGFAVAVPIKPISNTSATAKGMCLNEIIGLIVGAALRGRPSVEVVQSGAATEVRPYSYITGAQQSVVHLASKYNHP